MTTPVAPVGGRRTCDRFAGAEEELSALVRSEAPLRRALRLEQRHLARIGPPLLNVASERLFRDPGYRSLDDYARDELGMAASRARALLRLERLA